MSSPPHGDMGTRLHHMYVLGLPHKAAQDLPHAQRSPSCYFAISSLSIENVATVLTVFVHQAISLICAS